MNGDQLPTNQLHNINWGALDHASRAPHVCVCGVCVYMCVYVCGVYVLVVCVGGCVL